MFARPHPLLSAYHDASAALARLDPLVMLLLRFWVALAFWRAGVVKFDDPSGTRYLFESTYHVPLLAPDLAASVATWIELVAPWLLLLGLGGRLTAAFLFVYNLVAVVSYPDLWPHGFWTGLLGDDFNDHKVWAIMLLAVLVRGPGMLSVDRLLERLRPALRRRSS